METELLKRITHIPGLTGGKPPLRAMRFPVKTFTTACKRNDK